MLTTDRTRKLRQKMQKAIYKLRAEYEEMEEELQLILLDITEMCTHETVDYEADPSGGSDSWHVCDTCGGHWKVPPFPGQRSMIRVLA